MSKFSFPAASALTEEERSMLASEHVYELDEYGSTTLCDVAFRRLTNTKSGNPRYELRCSCGFKLQTSPDSGYAYAIDPPSMEHKRLDVCATRHGNQFLIDGRVSLNLYPARRAAKGDR